MEDNYSLWKRHEAQQEAWLSRRPVCNYCEQHIQEDYLFDIEGELICKDCLVTNFRKNTEDYMA